MATSNVRQHILGRATRTAPGGAALVRRAAVIWAHTTCARTECGCKVRAFGLCMQANVDNRAACSSCREGCPAGAQATARPTDTQLKISGQFVSSGTPLLHLPRDWAHHHTFASEPGPSSLRAPWFTLRAWLPALQGILVAVTDRAPCASTSSRSRGRRHSSCSVCAPLCMQHVAGSMQHVAGSM